MKRNSEEAIGRVLAGLQNTKASAGMERRILEAVERRAAVQRASCFRFYGVRPLEGGLVLAGFVALFLFIFISHRAAKPMHQAIRMAAPLPVAAEHPVTPTPSRSPARGRVALAMRRPARQLAVFRSTRMVNQPAPVAPLTNEEKLLLSIAHTGDPREMAMLNPEIRSQQAAAAEAQFKRFAEQGDQDEIEQQ